LERVSKDVAIEQTTKNTWSLRPLDVQWSWNAVSKLAWSCWAGGTKSDFSHRMF
jgi:hypothetical protein